MKNFTYYVKTFRRFYVERKNFDRAAFTLIELLVVIAVVAILAAILVPGLPAAKDLADSAHCRSNLRQLAAANIAFAADHGRYVAAASDIAGGNTMRWHGTREGNTFNGARGPLTPYIGGSGTSKNIRRCPALRTDGSGFEAACGGYGYNAVGIGSEQYLPTGDTTIGLRATALANPVNTIMFADTAYLQSSGGKTKLIEYSFIEPPQHISGGAPWPTLHFRHRRHTQVAWGDGHITGETLDHTGSRGAAELLGWFGPKNNTLFDPF